MWDLATKYAWFDTAYDLSWTISVIEGRTETDVIRSYGGDPAQPAGMLTYEATTVPEGEFGNYFHLQVLAYGKYVVAIENNGWTGRFPEIARRISKDESRFFSVYWNNGLSNIMQAEDGRIVAYFDPLYVEAGEEPQSGEVYPEWLTGVTIDSAHVRSISLAFLELQTGLPVEQSWLATKLPTYRIPDPDVLLKHVDDAREP